MKVLVIACGWEQEPLLKSLFSIESIHVFAVHYDKEFLNFPFADVLITDLRNLDKILDFAKENKVECVISDQDDFGHTAQAYVASNLNIPGPSFHSAQLSANKYLQRMRCLEVGVKIPKFSLVASIEDLISFVDVNGLPVIIKPIDNRGSIGVLKISSSNELRNKFYQSIGQSYAALCIVEEFIVGREVTVDGYCLSSIPKSLGIASKEKLDEDLQVSFEIKYPASNITKDLRKKIFKINEDVASILNDDFGFIHSEYLIDADENVYLVESANRGGGCFTSQLIMPEHTGVDVLSQYINDCLGQAVFARNDKEGREVMLSFISASMGKIKELNGFDLLMNDADVLHCRWTKSIGDRIECVTDDSNRLGFLIVKAVDDVVALTMKKKNLLTITIEK